MDLCTFAGLSSDNSLLHFKYRSLAFRSAPRIKISQRHFLAISPQNPRCLQPSRPWLRAGIISHNFLKQTYIRLQLVAEWILWWAVGKLGMLYHDKIQRDKPETAGFAGVLYFRRTGFQRYSSSNNGLWKWISLEHWLSSSLNECSVPGVRHYWQRVMTQRFNWLLVRNSSIIAMFSWGW